jgi:hypothetical protein
MPFNFQGQKYGPHSLHESKQHFYLCLQGKYMTTQAYLEHFQNIVDVIKHSGGINVHEPGIEKMVAHAAGVDVGDIDDMSKDEQMTYKGCPVAVPCCCFHTWFRQVTIWKTD